MSDQSYQEEPIDPRLEGLLESLRQVPPRDSQSAAAGRARYLTELQLIDLPAGRGTFWWITDLLPGIRTLKEEKVMSGKKLAIYAALSIVLAVMMLFGGVAATAYAAQSALPGDALYRLKTGLEEARLRLADDAAAQAELHLEFAERRLDELERLIDQRRYDDIGEAARALEHNIQQATEAFQIASQGDEQRAADLAVRLSQALSRYADALSRMMALVPDAVRPQVQQALSLSVSAGQTGSETEITGVVESQAPEEWVVKGLTIVVLPSTEIKGTIAVGDRVKVHAIVSEDGSLTAREIELATVGEDDEVNDNENVNENRNDNGNLNTNENDNSSLNDNTNQNQISNENQNGNDNEDAPDDNDNANGDDDNDNGDDDNDNENHDDDDDNENHDDDDDNENDDDD